MVKKKINSKIKKEELIVDKKEIESEVEKDSRNPQIDEEPKWYHYTIVLIVFFSVFAFGFFLLDYLEDKDYEKNKGLVLYDYYFTEGDRKGKVQFYTPINQIEELNFSIEVSKFELLNSEEIYFTFGEYNGSDNGEVTRASGRVLPFLQKVYLFPINVSKHIVFETSYTCLNSTLDKKIVRFDPYSDINAVLYNESNGCVEFLTNDPKNMAQLSDKFLFTLIEG
jgi:hypothetical protein